MFYTAESDKPQRGTDTLLKKSSRKKKDFTEPLRRSEKNHKEDK